MKIATITPTRGDRPKLLDRCIHQLAYQTVKPDNSFIINYKPKGFKPDIVERVRKGYELAKDYDWVFIIEDDDYYPSNYIEQMLSYLEYRNLDILGISKSLYYNIFERTYQTFPHPGRSSLFCTVLRGGMQLTWPNDHYKFLDLHLFKQNKNKFLISDDSFNIPIGIKHNIGETGGAGHRKGYLRHIDPDLSLLRELMDEESFEWYKEFSES